MAEPLPYDVSIFVNEVDVTQYVPFASMAFEDYARQVSTFSFTIENPSGVTPARNHAVYVTANSLPDVPIIFLGYIKELVSKKRDNGITKIYEVDCVDMKDRLLNSVIGDNDFTGSDLDILGDLLTNTYPDLSDLFDFGTDVTSFIDDMDFAVADGTSLLDALNDLADVTGADYRFENVAGGGGITVDFDSGYSDYTTSSVDLVTTETGFGNPDNAFRGTGDDAGLPKAEISIVIENLPDITPTGLTFDWQTDNSSTYEIIYRDGGVQQALFERNNRNTGGLWEAADLFADPLFGFSDDPADPFTVDEIEITIRNQSAPVTGLDFRIDNINIQYAGGPGGTPDNTSLVWDDTADLADFDIDVQNSDEFASDIDLYEGDFGDFNSVTVIGGYEEVAIDKALDNDGVRDHLSLPYPVSGLAVFVNTGTDTTPVWGSALDLGAWGSDTLTGDGGTKDVLHDAIHNWLAFDTAPPNMVNSWKITGTIRRPIRIRVETGEEPVLATTHTDETITSVDEAVAIAQAQLDSRSAIRRLDFVTPHPGLKPGQLMTVADSARGLSESLVIQKISTKWVGSSGHAEFHVECGDEENVGIDGILANVDRRSRQLSTSTSPDTQVASLLTSDGVSITSDGIAIYSIG